MYFFRKERERGYSFPSLPLLRLVDRAMPTFAEGGQEWKT